MGDKNINSNLDIFIYSHIPFRTVTDNHIYKILTDSKVAPSVFNTDLEIFRDYTGDNISNNNLMYNEYTGFYWLWKNYPLKDYVGLNHYRRMYENYDNLPDIDQIFKTKKIILNEPIQLVGKPYGEKQPKLYNNRDWYGIWHNIEDFEVLEKIIKEKYPKYADGFDVMANNTFLHGCSMFIMDKKTFVEYCEFVFSVLNDYRKEMGFFNVQDCIKYVDQHKDKYIKEGIPYYTVEIQARIVGYLAERVLGTFLYSGGKDSLGNNAEIFKWGMIPEEYYKIDQKNLEN